MNTTPSRAAAPMHPLFSPWARAARLFAALLVAAWMTGCAISPNADPRDPFEPFNRTVTKFNDVVDDAVLRPVATVYKEVVPKPARTGVGNFFGNLSDAWSFVNNVLQAKPESALHSFWRVVINSTIGLGGVLDPASEMRLERRREDFGQTLGYWGVPPGPYLVLPILGSSSMRDTVALPVDFYGAPLGQMHDVSWRNSLRALQIVDTRARVLEAVDLLESAALDPYTFTRDAYLQKRRSDVHDGNPPQDEERYDLDPAEGGAAAPDSPAAAPGAPRRANPPQRPRPQRAPGQVVAPPAQLNNAAAASPAPGAVGATQ